MEGWLAMTFGKLREHIAATTHEYDEYDVVMESSDKTRGVVLLTHIEVGSFEKDGQRKGKFESEEKKRERPKGRFVRPNAVCLSF